MAERGLPGARAEGGGLSSPRRLIWPALAFWWASGVDWSGLGWTGVEPVGWTQWSGLGWTRGGRWTGVDWVDWSGLEWTGVDWGARGLEWTGPGGRTGLDRWGGPAGWTGVDWSGLGWTGVDWLKEHLSCTLRTATHRQTKEGTKKI